MDPHKRMARTLACLVASMSIGAAFLDWLRPDDYSAVSRGGIELIARGAAPARGWEAVRVMTHAGDAGDLDLRTHFVVDPQGHFQPTRGWERQRVLDATPTVRVVLVVPPSQHVTPAQRSAAESLVSQLQSALGIAPNQVHWF